MTDFLYARPSVIEGIGRNMDFFGSMNSYNSSKNGDEADKIALANDLLAVYIDLQMAYYKTIWQINAKKTTLL